VVEGILPDAADSLCIEIELKSKRAQNEIRHAAAKHHEVAYLRLGKETESASLPGEIYACARIAGFCYRSSHSSASQLNLC
jgi:hypothetical protein